MNVKFITIICVLCVIRCHETKQVFCDCSNCPVKSDNIAYEYLLGKLQDVEVQFWNIWLEMKEQNQKFDHNRVCSKDDSTLKGIMQMLTRLEQAVGHNLTTVMERSSDSLQQRLSCADHENWRKSVLAMQLSRRTNSRLDDLKPFKSCAEVPSYVPGRYKIHPLGFEKPFEAYCEQKAFDGGWIVIQHRFDGSVDFYRNWTGYRNGFGSLDGEFWIGLEKLHRLTKDGNHQLLVELKDFNGNYKFARYDVFEIGTESEKYALKKLGSYSGTAGDGLRVHKSKQFSTEDSDNDSSTTNCAKTHKAAWWYDKCFNSNLNGLYKKVNDTFGLSWYDFYNNFNTLAYSRMMIRETSNNVENCPWLHI
nr:ficolin-1-like [Aedes albopictus]